MIINDKKMGFYASNMELVKHGFAEERLYNLTIRYEYTEKEKQENKAFAEKYGLNSKEWDDAISEAAQKKSDHMFPVMSAIAQALPCYQFADDIYGYDTDKWDLFFWCNDFWSEGFRSLKGRDYSHFTLGFNKLHSKQRREEILKKVFDILSEFKNDEHINITIQYSVELDKANVQHEAQRVSTSLIGKRVEYSPSGGLFNFAVSPMEGRIVESEGRLYFMKKRARNYGFLLSDTDILKLYWNMNEGRDQK